MKTARVWVERLGQTVEDLVAVEEPLEIRLVEVRGGVRVVKTVAITMRTPGDDEDLAVGFLFTEGILRRQEDLASIRVVALRGFVEVELAEGVMVEWKNLERNFYMSSSCGVCGKASVELVRTRLPDPPGPGMTVSGEKLGSFPQRLRAGQMAFDQTGGLHGAGLLAADGALVAIREDVGRHNAVDKVIASQWRAGEEMTERVLMLSGRASFELVQKAAMARIPVVASVGAPSSLAIELAETAGMTLCGFVRAERWNVYCGGERITA